MSDQEIVEQYWQHCESAIACSQEKYGAYCFSIAYHILNHPEDCEECVSDTWLHAWNAIPPSRPDALRMFFAKLTRSISFDRWRSRSAQKRGGGQLPLVLEELLECVSTENTVEDTVLAKELERSIRAFLRALPEREGDVFLRRYFFSESLKEIASAYGMTCNHVSVVLSRTRKELKRYLMKEGYCYEG